MRKIINLIISKIKGENFELDKRIPIFYLIRYFCTKLFCLLYGIIRLNKLCFIHPSTTIKCSSKFRIGKNFNVAQNCYIDALSERGLKIGNNVSLGYETHIELTGSLKLLGNGMEIGNNVGLGSHGHYGSGAGFLKIGDYTIFGNYVSIHPENHNYTNPDIPIKMQGVSGKGIIIGENCWIGAKATILDGTIIGNRCIVAAGAVVRGQFPSNCIIGGVPAHIIKRI